MGVTMEGWVAGCGDGRMDDGWVGVRTYDGWADRCNDGWVKGGMDGWLWVAGAR